MRRGTDYVEIVIIARTSASTLREHDMDLVTIFFHITGVSATSHVNLPKLIGLPKLCGACVFIYVQ